MKIAFFDCFSGVSGDMCLGALVSAGVDFGALVGELKKLPVYGYGIRQEKVKRNGISAVNIHVDLMEKEQPERRLSDIEEIIDGSSLPGDVRTKSKEVFNRLASAEAKVHDTTPDQVHFHEVGAVDAIVDVVGTVLGLELLGVEKVYASPLPMGKGFIECLHGIIPAPAPATLEILRDVPVYGSGIAGELVTPTGAALISALAGEFVNFPAMTISIVGYGSGKKAMKHPNLLRLVVGELYESRTPGPFPCRSPYSHTHPHGHLHGACAGGRGNLHGRCHVNIHAHEHEHFHAHGHDHDHDHDHGHNCEHGRDGCGRRQGREPGHD